MDPLALLTEAHLLWLDEKETQKKEEGGKMFVNLLYDSVSALAIPLRRHDQFILCLSTR